MADLKADDDKGVEVDYGGWWKTGGGVIMAEVERKGKFDTTLLTHKFDYKPKITRKMMKKKKTKIIWVLRFGHTTRNLDVRQNSVNYMMWADHHKMCTPL